MQLLLLCLSGALSLWAACVVNLVPVCEAATLGVFPASFDFDHDQIDLAKRDDSGSMLTLLPEFGDGANSLMSGRSMGKRSNAAIILDKLMFKIKQMAEEKEKSSKSGAKEFAGSKEASEDAGSGGSSQGESAVVTPDNMVSFSDGGFERRGSGGGSGKVYWRCYFNAVSCF